MSAQLALALPCAAASNTVVINARCSLRVEEDQRVIVVAGLPVHHYHAEDAVAEAYAMVFLVEAGFAQQTEVARAFARSERTVRRYQQRYAQGGMAALGRGAGWRRGRRRIRGKRLRSIEALKSQGLSNRAIAQRLGVSERAIRKLVEPSKSVEAEQLELGAITGAAASELLQIAVPSARSTHKDTNPQGPPLANDQAGEVDHAGAGEEPVPMSLDRDASDRSLDRQLAYLGLLDDAAPIFRDGWQLPGVGVLLAIPALVESGLLRIARRLYGEIGPAFYGLRTSLLTLLLMALLRIKRPEHLKEQDPAAFGRLLGLDRAPEVKTLRRKLTRLAAYERAQQLGAQLARVRVDQRGHLMGWLYVDGHVRAYHGERNISQAYVARRHLAMPATTDYWVNDRAGDPLLVITGEVNAALTKAFPHLLQEVRAVVGERRVTIVFDRGGWSPKLFHSMINDRFDILTYRKGKARRIHERRFVRRRAKLDGHWVSYALHDQPVRLLKGKLRLRQITRLCDNGHQTQVITNRSDLSDIELAWRMFERWRQENFFKYMREEFLLDALVDYGIEPEDPTRTIPNPERRALEKQLRSARTELASIEREYGAAAADNTEQRRPSMRGFKIAHGALGKKLRAARDRVAKLLKQRRELPRRVEVRDLSEHAVVKLATERKHLTNIIKMVAYQAESDLLALLRPNFARAEQEGRTLLHELFAAAGDIRVCNTELHITLAPLSSPHRTRAAHALCDILDQTAINFPGSHLRMRFAVRLPPRIGLPFPGSPAKRSAGPALASTP
ncbi:MAG: helix-turn-helix domain-containing protein [candidate division NC10 bacterium]|nr:helix-turn-helix domain-containing protein [candidate division NC10 bacterium]